jgi:translation elongation factor P/translation initiation factor 5A
MNMQSGRIRAWLRVMAENPDAAAVAISPYFNQGGDAWVIVRADVVKGGRHNLVVPIDVAEGDSVAWNTVLDIVRKAAGVQDVDVERVVSHYPTPTHKAHSFVTQNEVEAWRVPEFEKSGRHPQSPGANPWG